MVKSGFQQSLSCFCFSYGKGVRAEPDGPTHGPEDKRVQQIFFLSPKIWQEGFGWMWVME